MMFKVPNLSRLLHLTLKPRGLEAGGWKINKKLIENSPKVEHDLKYGFPENKLVVVEPTHLKNMIVKLDHLPK